MTHCQSALSWLVQMRMHALPCFSALSSSSSSLAKTLSRSDELLPLPAFGSTDEGAAARSEADTFFLASVPAIGCGRAFAAALGAARRTCRSSSAEALVNNRGREGRAWRLSIRQHWFWLCYRTLEGGRRAFTATTLREELPCLRNVRKSG